MADIDPRVLEDLNVNLQRLREDLGRMGTDRIITAMGLLGAELKGATKNKLIEQQYMDRFRKRVDGGSKALTGLAQSANQARTSQQRQQKHTGDLLRRQRDETRALISSYSDSNTMVLRLARGMGMGGKKLQGLNKALVVGEIAFKNVKGAVDSLGRGIGGIVSASFGTAAALAKGETSVTVFNSMIDAGARALADIGKSIPFFGAAISAVAGVAKFLLDMLQMVTNSMNTVAQVGGLAADGMDGFVQSTNQAGLALKQMEKVTTENASVMARFGGTVGDGLRRFSSITGDIIKTDLGRELRFLGFNREQIAEATAGFLNQQIRLGGARTKSDAELTRGAARYARELDALAKLTGMQRAEAQRQQDAALSEARFRAKMDELGPDESKRYLDFQTVLSKAAPGLAQGFRDLTAGYATTDAAQEFLRLGGQSVIDTLTGGGGPVEAFQRLQQVIEPQIGMAQSLAQVAGDDIRVLGKYVELRDVLNAKIVDGDIKLREQQQNQINSAGDLTQSIVRATEVMDELQRTMQQLAISMVPHATSMVTLFANTLMTGVDKILEILGLKGERGSIWRIVGTTAGAILGKMIGGMLGGLLGAIIGFLKGGPLGAAAGAALGFFGGSKLGAGLGFAGGGMFGYRAGDRMDSGASFLQAINPFSSSPAQGSGRGGRGRRRGPGVHGDEIEAQSGRVYRLDDAVAFGGGLTGTREHFMRLDPSFRERLFAMAVEYRNTTGRPMPFQSGHRSPEENARVGGASDSLHLRGLAADLGSATVSELQNRGMLEQFGFRVGQYPGATGSHIYRRGGVAVGPGSGFQATLHGREAVVPLPDGRSIPVELRSDALKPEFDRLGQRIETALRDTLGDAGSSGAMENTLQEVVRVMRDQLTISQKMLQAAQN